MKILSGISFFLLMCIQLQAQVTWADDVAEIMNANCASCHRAEGIAPFPLITYDDAYSNWSSIVDAVTTGYMPPWTADNDYQEYAHERSLTEDEKQTIVDWVTGGAVSGDLADAPPAPVFTDNGFLTATPDLELIMEPHTSNATNQYDDYICVSIPSGLTTDKRIRAFEVIPGNTEMVHHCLVYIDETGDYETNTSGVCGGPTEGLIGGYTPGALPTIFPSNDAELNLGITIPAGSNIVFALHYPAGSQGLVDQTKIRLFFYDETTEIREVNTNPIIQNWSFTVPADQEAEVEAEFNFIPVPMSILSVFPHMHLIGKSIESFAVTPVGDTIPFVRVNHWDFEWQEFYFFRHIQVLPAFSTIYGKGVYDNSSMNPHNPNSPPIDIGAGLNTSDEMFLVYYHFLPYLAGDELYDMEELTSLPVGVTSLEPDENGLKVYPNPASEMAQFQFDLNARAKVSLYIYDTAGRLVDKLVDRQHLDAGMRVIEWNTNPVSTGVYHYSMLIDGLSSAGRIVVE